MSIWWIVATPIIVVSIVCTIWCWIIVSFYYLATSAYLEVISAINRGDEAEEWRLARKGDRWHERAERLSLHRTPTPTLVQQLKQSEGT